MQKFKGPRTLDEILAEAKKRGWKIDDKKFTNDGDDWIKFKFGNRKKGWILLNTANTRFFGETDQREHFDSNSDENDSQDWFKDLLTVFYEPFETSVAHEF